MASTPTSPRAEISVYVRLCHLADIRVPLSNVRFWGKSRYRSEYAECPLLTKADIEQSQKTISDLTRHKKVNPKQLGLGSAFVASLGFHPERPGGVGGWGGRPAWPNALLVT
jgi:hypothetical protein